MIRINFIILLIFISLPSQSQNLVPNPSFEDTVYCPNNSNQVDACLNWFSAGMPSFSTPDYLNVCSIVPALSPPSIAIGNQYPVTGNAYCHIILYTTLPNPAEGREYISCQLISSLSIGQKYFVSFYTNLGGSNGASIACNKLGVLFTSTSFSSSHFAQPTNFSHIVIDSIITDTVNWHHVKASFIADSTYQFMTIGNFYDNLSTDTVNLVYPAYTSGYLIDDVCLSLDSNLCFTYSGEVDLEDNSKFEIFPNPADQWFYIDSKLKNIDVSIYNIEGKEVFNKNLNENFKVECSKWKAGFYLVKSKSFIRKLFIYH